MAHCGGKKLLIMCFSKLSSRPWQDVTPGAKILLRMSLYQLWHMNRIPDHALVNDAVELAKRGLGKGIDKYLNGNTSKSYAQPFMERIQLPGRSSRLGSGFHS